MSKREKQPRRPGWKEGVLAEDLRSVGGTTHKRGDAVRYKRYRVYGDDMTWTGAWEYHYLDETNYNLVRSPDLLIKI